MKSLTEYLWFESPGHRGFVTITGQATEQVQKSGVREGLCLVNAMHRITLPMNLPSKEEPPLPNPLLHKYVEERKMERRGGFMGSMRECVRGILTLRLGLG